MADNTVVQGVRELTSPGSLPNAIEFMIRTIINNRVNTALPVIVTGVTPGGVSGATGYVNVKPLICQTDAQNKALPTVTIFRLPYFRLQAGVAAVVIDPVIGDIGLAIFAQADCSVLVQGASTPVQPGSWRKFDQADGFYIGGFLNVAPSLFIELRQDGRINMTAADSINLTTPKLTVSGKISAGDNVSISGSVAATGDIVAGAISVQNHTHGGVQSGSSNTEVPNA